MISPNKKITATSLKQYIEHSDAKDLIGGIRNKENYQIKTEYSTPLIDNLEIKELFKDEDEEEGVGIIDLISRIIQVLRRDLYWVKISMQKTGLMELVELWDKG